MGISPLQINGFRLEKVRTVSLNSKIILESSAPQSFFDDD